MTARQNPPVLELGSFRVAFLTDGLWYNDGGCMFGVVPRPLWQRNHPPDAQNRVRLNLTCPLIMRGRDAILVDCGIGNRLSDVERRIFSHGEGWLSDGLAALGMEAGDITHVVLSHLHFDHCGGLVRRRPSGALERAFAHARHFIQRGEYRISVESGNERLRAAYRHAAECLGPLAGSIELLDGDSAVVPGVEAVVTGGHTQAHQIAVVRDAGQVLAHMADIIPTRSHMRGPWNQAYDLDPLTTMERKAHYLLQASTERWWVSFAHDDRVFGARVNRAGGSWELTQEIAVAEFGQ